MHELGIVLYVIDEVEKVAKKNNVELVTKVTLEVGEVSGIVPSYFQDCWKWSVEKTEHMKGCLLDIIVIQAKSYCEDCGTLYKTTEGRICPKCKSKNTYLVSGKETLIKNIEVKS